MNTLQAPKWSQLLQSLREQLRESQTEFGAHFGVTKSAVSQWENGQTTPTPENLRELTKIEGGEQIVKEFYGL